MNYRYLTGIAMLFAIAALWGLGFVFQREGMDHVGPYTFNALRFVVGALSVLPVIALFSRNRPKETEEGALLKGGILAGGMLFMGITLQQIGLIHTTAGKSSFITGLYMIFVPMVGIVLGYAVGRKVWVAAALALVGLYLLSVTSNFEIAKGDGVTFICAFFWTGQVMVTGHYSTKVDGPRFALVQFVTVAALSIPLMLIFETVEWGTIKGAASGILYTGLAGTGLAMTLQILAQARVPSVQAALIMSLETVFGAIGGWWILNEILTPRMALGCALMLFGIVIAQLPGRRRQKPIRWAFRRRG
ncbi:MAG: DMT family transporter [Halocynthiibacter sp.]